MDFDTKQIKHRINYLNIMIKKYSEEIEKIKLEILLLNQKTLK